MPVTANALQKTCFKCSQGGVPVFGAFAIVLDPSAATPEQSLVYSTYLEVANYPVQATSRMELPWTAWVGPLWWAALFLPIFQ